MKAFNVFHCKKKKRKRFVFINVTVLITTYMKRQINKTTIISNNLILMKICYIFYIYTIKNIK